MTGYVLAIVLAIVVLATIVQLMRTRRLREKYAAVWIVLAVGIVVLAVFPRLAFWVAHHVGVETPANLLFAVAAVVLLGVCLQLSGEVSSLEEKTRTLAEEIALLRLDVETDRRTDRAARADGPTEQGGPDERTTGA